jgi:prophage regulatory protein
VAKTILRLPALMARIGRSRSSVYADIKSGLLVSPIHIGARAVGWVESEVDVVMDARIAGNSTEAIRELVLRLEAARSGNSIGLSSQMQSRTGTA